MKRFLYHLACLVALTAGLTADGQFAEFPSTTTTFLRGDNTWATPTTFGAISATTIAASGAQTNSSTLGVAGAITAAGALGVSGRTTFGAGLTMTPTTLVPASGGTNYGIDMSLWSSAYKAMTNHMTFTGITNNAAGAYFRAMIHNSSGGDLLVRVPAGGIYYSDPSGFPLTVTNTTAVLIEVFGMGTQSTNALWAYRRFVP